LAATFQATFAAVNGLNTEFCDPFFRVVTDVQGARVEQSAEQQQQQQQQQQRQLQEISPSSAPSFAPSNDLTRDFVSIFSFLELIVSGASVGSGNDDINGVLLDPTTANDVSNRRLGQARPDAYEIDPSSGMVTDRRLQEDKQDDCVCVADAERRGVRVSLRCILLFDCIATKDSWTYLIVMHSLCSYYPLIERGFDDAMDSIPCRCRC
jgi:hypothetical protein